MSSTEGLHLKTVAMLQGSSHLRVQSSAEFQVAAGAKLKFVPSLSTVAGAGNVGTLTRDGISVITTTGTGDNSTCIWTLPAPAVGSWKKIIFRCVNATSNRQRVVTSSKGVKIGTSQTSIIATSHARKIIWGNSIELVGVSTFRWAIASEYAGSLVVPTTVHSYLVFTSATG